MVKVFLGKKGIGKTKKLLEMANNTVNNCAGEIVYIDDDNRHIFDLHHKIRFVNTADFNIDNSEQFYGFICGMISANYDIKKVFIDGLTNIIQENLNDLKGFFNKLKTISNRFKLDLIINVNADPEEIPDFLDV